MRCKHILETIKSTVVILFLPYFTISKFTLFTLKIVIILVFVHEGPQLVFEPKKYFLGWYLIICGVFFRIFIIVRVRVYIMTHIISLQEKSFKIKKIQRSI